MPIDSPAKTLPAPARGLGLSADLVERVMLVIMLSAFAMHMAVGMKAHPVNLLIVLSEGFAVALVLIRKPGAIAATPYAWAIALAGTFIPLLVSGGGTVLIPGAIASPMMLGGILVSVLAKIFLNRSFGIVAANRGVKIHGPYRLVRHPMYLGYLLTQMGFLLSSFSALNVIFYACAWSAQLLRIREEEGFLLRDPAYRAYADRVRARIIPGLF